MDPRASKQVLIYSKQSDVINGVLDLVYLNKL